MFNWRGFFEHFKPDKSQKKCFCSHTVYSRLLFYLREKVVVSRAQLNPFFRGYKLMFSFHRLLNFVELLCCNYHEYQIQKVIFFSASVFSSVMPKTLPFSGHVKGPKDHPRLSKFLAYLNSPNLNWVQPVWIIEDALYKYSVEYIKSPPSLLIPPSSNVLANNKSPGGLI